MGANAGFTAIFGDALRKGVKFIFVKDHNAL
jgi:hypothetical protein